MSKRGRPKKSDCPFTVKNYIEYTSDSELDADNVIGNVQYEIVGSLTSIQRQVQQQPQPRQVQQQPQQRHVQQQPQDQAPHQPRQQQAPVEHEPRQQQAPVEHQLRQQQPQDQAPHQPRQPLPQPQPRHQAAVQQQENNGHEIDEFETESEFHSDNEMQEDYNSILTKLKSKWLFTEAHHTVSKSASEAFWKLSLTYFNRLYSACGPKKKIPLFKTIRNKMHKDLVPDIDLEIGYKNLSTGEVFTVNDTKTQMKNYPSTSFEKIFEIATLKIEDIKKIHSSTCKSHFQTETKLVKLSLDGVAETKSTSVSLDVYTIKFEGCRDVFPIKIVRPINKHPMNNQEQLSSVLNSVMVADLIIKAIVGDNPKRSFLRFSFCHSAKFACEYCFESGVSFKNANPDETSVFLNKLKQQQIDIQNKIDSLDDSDSQQIETLKSIAKHLSQAEKMCKKQRQSSHIVWPASTYNGEMRTKEKVLKIVEDIEAGKDLTPEERKGIKGRSLLLDIDYFDYINSLPTEYMHLLALGVVKRLLELTFNVGETRPRNISRPLTPAALFNDLIKNLKVPHECSRRIRKLDLAVMKAQELRNVLIFFFPVVTQCLGNNEKEIKIWEMLAFMIRACILPEEEFAAVNVQSIKYCQENFYKTYQKLFGIANCTYSIHVLCSHLLTIRSQGPLTESSAFIFEAFYAELRKSFQPGTVSVLKQMMQTVILKRSLSNHVCEETILYKEKDTAMECNSLIYTYESNVHVIYKIISIEENGNFLCNQLGNHEMISNHTNMLNWSSVGVYKRGGLSSLQVIVPNEKISGKVFKVGNYLLTCPVNILREK